MMHYVYSNSYREYKTFRQEGLNILEIAEKIQEARGYLERITGAFLGNVPCGGIFHKYRILTEKN
jgi:hypothetical protein